MGRLTCRCLNISVHTKAVPSALNITALRLSSEEQDDTFFKSRVAEVQLDLGGIAEAQKCLIRRYSVGSWVVRTCLNCNTESYATHISKGMNRVLISLNLVSDTSKQEEIQRSPDFSSLFHLLLHDVNKIKIATLGLPTTSNQDALKKMVGDLQEQLTRYLTKEKSSMEERIKKFAEDQQALYAVIQKKAYRDKNVMVGLIVEADEKCLQDSISEAMLETALTPPQTPVSLSGNKRVHSSESSHNTSSPRALHGGTPSSQTRTPSVVLKAYGSTVKAVDSTRESSKPTRSRNNDADTLFDLDGFNDDCDPFFESDDECSTDDNSLNDNHLGRVMSTRNQTRPHNYAHVSANLYACVEQGDEASYEDEDEDDKVPMPEPDRMVASMRALSFSVQDGTEMFGDLQGHD